MLFVHLHDITGDSNNSVYVTVQLETILILRRFDGQGTILKRKWGGLGYVTAIFVETKHGNCNGQGRG
jgi:hypothetical protein